MSQWTVTTDKEALLAQRLTTAGLREEDIDETFVRSSGPGGQNVNKTATCVLLVHRPSGLQVKCQTTRLQGLNRFLARQLLLEKVLAQRRTERAAERDRVEKLRRQKRPRSRGAQQRILADKAHRSATKSSRRQLDDD